MGGVCEADGNWSADGGVNPTGDLLMWLPEKCWFAGTPEINSKITFLLLQSRTVPSKQNLALWDGTF